MFHYTIKQIKTTTTITSINTTSQLSEIIIRKENKEICPREKKKRKDEVNSSTVYSVGSGGSVG